MTTLHWHQYVLLISDMTPAELELLMTQIRAARGRVLWDYLPRNSLVLSIPDTEPWQSIFELQFSQYIQSSTAHSQTYR